MDRDELAMPTDVKSDLDARWEARAEEPVRLAVVGLGHWGPNLVRNIHELPEAELVSMCDLRPAALQSMHLRYPGVPGTTSFDELLDDQSIEAIVLATPVSTHYALAAAALEAGKHVFVEKPLAASSNDAHKLTAQARQAGVTLMVGHTFLYSPPVNAIHDLIRGGHLGELYFITTSRVNLGLHQSDTSVIWDLGPHDFSILRHWLGEQPVRASATSRSCVMPGVPDVAFINLEYAQGTIAHVELSWLSPSKLRRTAIVGSEKMVVYDDMSIEPVRVFDSGVDFRSPETFGEFQLSYRTGDIVSPRIDAAEPLSLELLDFCESIRTGRTPISSDVIGCDVVSVIEAVDASLAAEGRAVDVAPVATNQ